MKKIITALLIFLFAAGIVYALDFSISGEARTGVYAEWKEEQGIQTQRNILWNNDGITPGEGLVRLRFNLVHQNIGLTVQFSQQGTKNEIASGDENPFRNFEVFKSEYIYAWGSLFNDQLTITAGMLEDHPWGVDGDEMRQDLGFTNEGGARITGVRTEYKPFFLPGLNLGLVFNRYNLNTPPKERERPMYDILNETILGARYDHEYFALRFSWRLDSANEASLGGEQDGMEFVYRVEERILGKYVPGLHIMLDGHREGMGTAQIDRNTIKRNVFTNWLYICYDYGDIIANLNTRFEEQYTNDSLIMWLRPKLVYRLLNNVLNVGMEGNMVIGLRDNVASRPYADSVLNSWYIEPMVRVNFSSNAYAALHYSYGQEYISSIGDKSRLHWLNLRVSYSF